MPSHIQWFYINTESKIKSTNRKGNGRVKRKRQKKIDRSRYIERERERWRGRDGEEKTAQNHPAISLVTESGQNRMHERQKNGEKD